MQAQLETCQRSALPTTAGFIYLAVVLDAFRRRIGGWSLAGHLRTELPDGRRFRNKFDARSAIFEFIEGWYNPPRRHSANNRSFTNEKQQTQPIYASA